MKVPLTIIAVSMLAASTAFAFSPVVRNSSMSIARGNMPRFFSSTAASARSSTMQMMTPADFVTNEIASYDVVVFSKTYCPFCTATKHLMRDLSIDAKVIELDVVPNGDQIQAALLASSGQRTVPNVFIKGIHLGGNDDTQAAARSGKLQEMLK